MEDQDESGFGLVVYLACTIPVFCLIYYRLRRLRMLHLASKLPGPKGLPIIGNALDFMDGPRGLLRMLMNQKSQIDDVTRLWFGPRLVVLLSHPADIEMILGSQSHLDKSPDYQFFTPWLQVGLLLTQGDRWTSHRKLVSPMFHLSILQSFVPRFNRISQDTVESLKKEAGVFFDCRRYTSEAIMKMLLESALGEEGSSQQLREEYAGAVNEMSELVYKRQTSVWLRADVLFMMSKYQRAQKRLLTIIHNHTKQVLKCRRTEHQKRTRLCSSGGKHSGPGTSVQSSDETNIDPDEGRAKSFMDLLLETAQGGVIFIDDEIRHHIDTIIFKGHETTAAACSFFLCIMAARPDIQNKVVEELTRIFGDSDKEATMEDTLEMRYMERCIMETLRLYPPVPLIARQIHKETTLASTKNTLPADCTVVMSPYRLHRRPDLFPDPDHFDPDHFLPERSSSRHYYSFIPFSAGPRSCLGRTYAMMQLKILLSWILRNYEVVGGDKEDAWRLEANITLTRADGFKIKIRPRNLIVR